MSKDNVPIHVSEVNIKYMNDRNIDVLTYPPNTTSELQGLDKVMFGPFKRLYHDDVRARLRLPAPEFPNKKNFPR